ncbi:hypothetical protein [Ancylobacter sp. SL191]|uniref:hypothetical protein n=1 Tax=Ancylobacter sp. SL191 TaxID=2995166 RepID=UPI00226FD17F|nr:hypothetical protein [Ancylobacter sp. SL191]WAC26865.1 hypothetical protein OU996_17930 [Ancylobacter sp. SL191]
MRKTFVVATAALLVALVGGYFALGAIVNHFARRQVDALFADLGAAGIEAHRGEVRFDLFKGHFEIENVSFTSPGQGSLKLTSLVADGLTRPDDRRFTARQIDIHDLSFDGPAPLAPMVDISYRAPKIEITGVEGPTVVTPDGTEPAQIALAVLEALKVQRVAIPESLVTTRSGTGNDRLETDVTHGAVALEDIAGGRVARASIAPSRFTAGGAPANAATGRVGRVSIETIDVAALLILLDPQRRAREENYRTLYGTVKVDGYELKADSGLTQRWSTIEIADVAIRPSAIPAEELLASGQRIQQLAAKGEQPAPAEMAAMLRAMAATYDGLRIRAIAFKDMTALEADGTKVELAALTAGPLNEGKLDSLALDRLKGTEADGSSFHLDTLKIGGLRPGAIMELAADAAESPEATRDIAWLMRLFGIVSSFTLEGAEAPVEKGGEPVVIDRASLSWSGETDALPTRMAASLRVTGPTAAFAADKPVFALVPDGMQRASVALDIGGEWNEAASTLTLAPLYAEVSDAFALSVKLSLSDVDDALFSPQPDEALAGALGASLAALEITVSDAGIYERKLEEAAKQQDMEPEALRQLLAGFAELLLAQTVADRPDLEPATQALVAFIQKPLSTLSLRITPRHEQLPVMTIVEAVESGEPLGLIDEINVQLTQPLSPVTP